MNSEFHPPEYTILVVDDEERNRELLRSWLEAEGYDVMLADNGEEAMLLAEGLQPDLVLLDVMMPDVDGFEVCRRLRQTPRTREVPIVLVTALDDRDSRITGLAAGADEFLTKPIDKLELDTRVRTVCGLNRYRQVLCERSKFAAIAAKTNHGCVLLNREGLVTYANPYATRLVPRIETGEPLKTAAVASGYRLMPSEAWSTNDPGRAIRFFVQPADASRLARWLQVEFEELDPPLPDERLCRITDVSSLMQQKRQLWSFHSVLAHKFRTPLAGIIGVVDLLLLDTADGNRALLEGLHSASRRMESQIQSVLQYVESPRLLVGKPASAVGVIPLLQDLAAEAAVDSVGCRITEAAEPQSVVTPEPALAVIFTELIANSIKFSPHEKPTLELLVDVDEKGFCRVEYRDDGRHIEPDRLEHICKPYIQGERYFTGEAPGMGLGLAMIAGLMWECGGSLSVTNRADAPGVLVRLDIPVAA